MLVLPQIPCENDTTVVQDSQFDLIRYIPEPKMSAAASTDTFFSFLF